MDVLYQPSHIWASQNWEKMKKSGARQDCWDRTGKRGCTFETKQASSIVWVEWIYCKSETSFAGGSPRQPDPASDRKRKMPLSKGTLGPFSARKNWQNYPLKSWISGIYHHQWVLWTTWWVFGRQRHVTWEWATFVTTRRHATYVAYVKCDICYILAQHFTWDICPMKMKWNTWYEIHWTCKMPQDTFSCIVLSPAEEPR